MNRDSCGRSMSGDEQKEKAVTLVMLKPTTPARESPAWTHVPSQPLMRSPLSQFQTPADTSQCSRFFRVWSLAESPRQADHPVYFGTGNLLEASPFDRRRNQSQYRKRAIDARGWCNLQIFLCIKGAVQVIE